VTAASPAKFRFDLDLGHREERNSVMSEGAMAALLNNARAEGFQDGVAEGQRGAVVRAAEGLAQAAETLADHTAALNASLDDARNATLAEAVELAATIGRKLAAHLLAQQPTAEIEALITECLASLDAVPHLVIRCAPDLADAVREIALARIASSASPAVSSSSAIRIMGWATPSSNGSTAASSAIAPRSKARSMSASRNISPPAAAPTTR